MKAPPAVRDLMTREVVTVREDTSFRELVRTMTMERVSGLPVLGPDDRLAGIVTEADLLRAGQQAPPPKGLLVFLFTRRRELEELRRSSEDHRARDLMTRDVVTVGPDTPLHLAARAMLDAGVKRLPVVDATGLVVGIVSRRDLLGPFLRSDEDIYREVTGDIFLRTMWLDPRAFQIKVHGGVVTLEGRVDLKSTHEILVELVRRVPGVVGVQDSLKHRGDDRRVSQVALAEPDLDLVQSQG